MGAQLKLVPYEEPPRKLTIEERFAVFMESHPEFYEAFKDHAFALMGAGHKKYSADGIFHVIRFHSAIRDSTSGFKVNNDFTRPMADLFRAEFPDHAEFFPKREGGRR